MKDGFLGYYASPMLDFVVVALVAIAPVLVLSIWLVRVQRQYGWHRQIQLGLAGVLLLAVLAFEIDLHWIQGGWEAVVAKRTPPATSEQLGRIRSVLQVHLIFAISTPVLWIITIALALRYTPRVPGPSAHSRLHKLLGWSSAIDLVLTSATGLLFYYTAFIAAR